MQRPNSNLHSTVHWLRQYWFALALVLVTAVFMFGARTALAASSELSVNQTVPPPTPRPTTAPPKPNPGGGNTGAVAVASVAATNAATQTVATTPLTATVQAVTLNVRQGPGTSFPVIGKLSQGTVVTVSGRNAAGDWWQICCLAGGTTPGWVSAQLLTPGFTDAQAATLPVGDEKSLAVQSPVAAVGGKAGAVNAVTLNLRSSPATDGPVIAKLRQNDAVSVLGRNEGGDWLFVCCAPGAQTRGWVSAQYVTPAFALADLAVTTGAETPAVQTTKPVSGTGTAEGATTDATGAAPATVALNVTVAQSPAFAIQGKALSLVVTIENPGSTAATNVELRNELPEQLSYIAATASADGAVSEDGAAVVVKWAEVPAGGKVSATVQTMVDKALANGTTFANLATVTADNTAPAGAGITVDMPPSVLPEFW